jgi:pimeloyl-ACP methyl ester carboxylesterase
MSAEPRRFTISVDGGELAGEALGEGPPVVLLHGLTASRRYVVHGSKVLPRKGFRTVAYDARGHGQSRVDQDGQSYGYPRLAADLERVLESELAGQRPLLAGHSMGAHTATAFALEAPDQVAGLVLVGPASRGVPPTPEVETYWDSLADALERDGVEGFLKLIGADYDDEWRERVLGFTRERMSLHSDLGNVAQALREVTRSLPFEGTGELENLNVPALVVASHDEADPGHPYAVAEEWAERLPQARLISEPEGAAPLAWQGGRLSREIAAFADEAAVRERLSD